MKTSSQYCCGLGSATIESTDLTMDPVTGGAPPPEDDPQVIVTATPDVDTPFDDTPYYPSTDVLQKSTDPIARVEGSDIVFKGGYTIKKKTAMAGGAVLLGLAILARRKRNKS